jgi:hypothetical protein
LAEAELRAGRGDEALRERAGRGQGGRRLGWCRRRGSEGSCDDVVAMADLLPPLWWLLFFPLLRRSNSRTWSESPVGTWSELTVPTGTRKLAAPVVCTLQ